MRWFAAVFVAVIVCGFAGRSCAALPVYDGTEKESRLYGDPQPVTIEGYDGQLMEPFVSLDGQYLFFNNQNSPKVDTNLHFAKRTGDLSFKYMGELPNANAPKLDAAASMDKDNRVYYTTVREYDRTRISIYTGVFDGEALQGVHPVTGGITPARGGHINMDVSISPDGETMYISRAVFGFFSRGVPKKSDILLARRTESGFDLDPKSDEIMKNVNTPALEYAPAISADGLELYFTRASRLLAGESGEGAAIRIMVARRAAPDVPFGAPERLVELAGFVEAPTFPRDGAELFYHKKTGDKLRLYRAVRRPEASKK